MLKIIRAGANPRKSKKPEGFDKFNKVTRENWGYWDGINAKKLGKYPPWTKSTIYRGKHPFDKAYGEGFWRGWYGEEPPNKYTMGKKNPKRRTKIKTRSRRKKRIACRKPKRIKKRKVIRARKNPGGMFLEYDWTYNVFRPRFGDRFIDVRGERSWPNLKDAKHALNAAGLKLGKKTDTRTWRIENKETVSKNPYTRKRYETLIVGYDHGRGKHVKRYWYTGKSFSRNRDEAKIFAGDAAKMEARRIINSLPPAIYAIRVETVS